MDCATLPIALGTRLHHIGRLILRWGFILAALWFASHYRTPVTAKWPTGGAVVPVLIMAVVISASLHAVIHRSKKAPPFYESLLYSILASIVLVHIVLVEIHFQAQRRRVLNAREQTIQMMGRHFIIGFDNLEEVRCLAEKGAIGGLYLTRRNVADKSIEQVYSTITSLQQLRTSRGLPPLIIAADQEGGMVNHLSPPLPPQPPLASVVGAAIDRADLVRRTAAYASRQALGLAAMGVNLNLSPVVDLPGRQEKMSRQSQTRIDRRAIANDKVTIADMALSYCRGLNQFGVWPTLKHFPGLGLVAEETHLNTGQVALDLEQLNVCDWVPFKEVLHHTQAFLMLGHVRLLSVDPVDMVFTSPHVVQTIIRGQWRFNGILITDDLDMGPVWQNGNSIGDSAVRALNAGVDLLLISYDGRQFYPAMAALLAAIDNNTLNLNRILESRRRLDGLWDPSSENS